MTTGRINQVSAEAATVGTVGLSKLALLGRWTCDLATGIGGASEVSFLVC